MHYTGGKDFELEHQIIQFPVGSVNNDLVCIHITIIDDIFVEKNEYFSLHIKLLDQNAWVYGSLYVNIHIYDNDCTLLTY